MTKLSGKDKNKIMTLIKNTNHELSIESAVRGNIPCTIYADNSKTPGSGLIKTPECNVLFGEACNSDFNSEISAEIDYYDQITCDNSVWEEQIHEIHPNIALRKYNRCYYRFYKTGFSGADQNLTGRNADIIYPGALNNLAYTNADMVTDWIILDNPEKFENTCMAAVIPIENEITACSGLDCIADDKIEIGINTVKKYRKQGFGSVVVRAMAGTSFSNGIKEIGWHCVSTNTGSRKIAEHIGFKHILSYKSYTPYPPIENSTDLTPYEWIEWTEFYMKKAEAGPVQYWQASRCLAHAGNMDVVKFCFTKLLENKILWFMDSFRECDEFEEFNTDNEWIEFIKSIDQQRTI